MKIRFFVEKQLLRLQCRSYTASVCGHKTKLKGMIGSDQGWQTIMVMPVGDDGNPEFCIQCVDAMSIFCGWCGNRIIVGDPVTLMVPIDGYNVVGARYGDGLDRVVGCLSWGCGEAMAMSGHWYPPGVVSRKPSPLEVCMATGKSVFMNDVSSGEVHVIGD